MKKYFSILGLAMAISLIGCQPDVIVTQPQAQQSQQVISGTCVNGNNQVLEDNYCDPNWISSQRMIAQQRHDQAMLDSLLLYHMLYTPNPYMVGAYIPRTGVIFYNRPPMGYVVQSRRTYVTNVTNHTIVVNNGRAVTRSYSAPSSTVSRPSSSSSTTRGGFGSSSSNSYSRPSYNSGSSSRSSSSFGSSASRSRR